MKCSSILSIEEGDHMISIEPLMDDGMNACSHFLVISVKGKGGNQLLS